MDWWTTLPRLAPAPRKRLSQTRRPNYYTTPGKEWLARHHCWLQPSSWRHLASWRKTTAVYYLRPCHCNLLAGVWRLCLSGSALQACTKFNQCKVDIFQDCHLFTALRTQTWLLGPGASTHSAGFSSQSRETRPVQKGQTSALHPSTHPVGLPLFTVQRHQTWPDRADLNTTPQYTSCRTVPSSQSRETRPDQKGQTSAPSFGDQPLAWSLQPALWHQQSREF